MHRNGGCHPERSEAKSRDLVAKQRLLSKPRCLDFARHDRIPARELPGQHTNHTKSTPLSDMIETIRPPDYQSVACNRYAGATELAAKGFLFQ